MTAPVVRSFCEMVSVMSPVPGGRSRTQVVERRPSRRRGGTGAARSGASARATRRPSFSSSSRKPIVISFTPKRSSGRKLRCPSPSRPAGDAEHGRHARAVHVRVEQADRLPSRLSASARFVATGLLPTPPLPLITRTTSLHRGWDHPRRWRACRATRPSRLSRQLGGGFSSFLDAVFRAGTRKTNKKRLSASAFLLPIPPKTLELVTLQNLLLWPSGAPAPEGGDLPRLVGAPNPGGTRGLPRW